MIARKIAFAALSALILIAGLGAASGQFPTPEVRVGPPLPPDGPGPVASRPDTTVPRHVAPPNFTLDVYYGSRIPEAKVPEYRELRDQLNQARIGVPIDRIAYSDDVIGPTEWPIGGWGGSIESFKKVKGGVVVDLRIHAKQGGMQDTANIIERYSLIRDKVSYLGFYVPNDIPRVQVGY